VIDTSASMSAQDPVAAKPRIELAKIQARELVASLPPGSDAMILDAGRDPRVAMPPDRDIRRLRRAIDSLNARDAEGDLGAAVSLAVGRLTQVGGRRKIVVLTDGNLARPATLTGSAVPLEVIEVGTPVSNAGIVRVDVRAGSDPVDRREQVQAFLLVGNFGDKPRELFVTMRQRNASDVLASRKVVVPAGERLPVVLTFKPTPGDYGSGLVFDIAPHDAMPVDDTAYGRVPAGRRLPVVFAAAKEPSPWLLRALVADPDAEVRQGGVAELLSKNDVDLGSFVVVQDACPASLPGGDLLIVNPPPGECYGAMVAAPLDKPVITSWDHNDERMRFLTLDGVFVGTARALEPQSKRQELVRSDKGVIVADVSSSARSATLVGFDVGESNWPLKASFVLFVRNLLEQARLHRSSGVSGPALAGDPLRVSVPSNVREAEIESPDGSKQRVPVRGGLAVVPEVQRLGLYRVSFTEPVSGSVLVPVNLTSAAESNLSEKATLTGEGEVQVTEAGAVPESHQSFDWVLALVALAFIVLDVWYLTRRPRRASLASKRPLMPARRLERHRRGASS
jgi:hypothetical protein